MSLGAAKGVRMPGRAETQGGERSGRSAARWAVGLAFGFGLGCLNLDLPTVPPTPPLPSLTILTPRPGDTINLAAQVSVAASSVDGIASVSVLCGPLDGGAHTIYTWAAAPYLANVDFSPCQDVTQPNPVDGGYPLLQVGAQALSDAGALQQATVQVYVNTVGPQLTVQYPPSAQPNSPFTVQVTSNVPLASFPQVTLGNLPGQVSTVVAADGGVTYVAYFSNTPGLGTDNFPYDAGVPVPIEVLTDTEEVVRLTVTATAQGSGNSTEIDLSVDLTRVVWDRYIPGQPASSSPIQWAADPVAFAQGLVLPLSTTAGGDATSVWIPGVLGRVDGTFFGFNPSVLDGGYVATGLNARGETLAFSFIEGGSNLLLAPAPNVHGALVTASGGPASASAPLTRVDDRLCLQDSVTACSAETTESLTCYTPQLATVTATSGVVSTGPPTPGVVAGAGGRYLSPNVGLCGSSWNLVDLLAGTVSLGPTVDTNGCIISAVDKLLAVGDGTFVVQLTSNCSVTGALAPVYPILRVGAGSAILGAYTAPQASPSRVQAELVAALADGRVVTLSNAPPYTNFALWSLNSTTPDVVTPIAGLYDTADDALGSVLAESTYSAADGSFAVLLSGATLGVGVLAFGPDLQPLWLYVYPRVTDPTNSRLVSAPSVSDVYLVDQFNNYAVSLRVVPPAPSADAGPADGGIAVSGQVVDLNSVPVTGAPVVLSSSTGTQTELSDSNGAFSFGNVQTPYTLSAVYSVQSIAVTYQGLTIGSPTIQLPITLGGNNYAAVAVSVDGGVYPQPSNYRTTAAFISPQASQSVALSPAGTQDINPSWLGPSTITGSVYALQAEYADATYTVPLAYIGYATLENIAVEDTGYVPVALTLAPIATGTLSGTVTQPPGSTLSAIALTLLPVSTSSTGLFFLDDQTGSTSFSYTTPSIPGTALQLEVYSGDTAGNYGRAIVTGLAPTTTNLAITIPASPTLLAPVNGATGVTASTEFSCTTFSSGIYEFSIVSNNDPLSYYIFSESPTVTIPDLSAAGFAVPPSGSPYAWSVSGYAPVTSVDQLAMPYVGNTTITFSPTWYITYGP